MRRVPLVKEPEQADMAVQHPDKELEHAEMGRRHPEIWLRRTEVVLQHAALRLTLQGRRRISHAL